jgi:hypothetical protein
MIHDAASDLLLLGYGGINKAHIAGLQGIYSMWVVSDQSEWVGWLRLAANKGSREE